MIGHDKQIREEKTWSGSTSSPSSTNLQSIRGPSFRACPSSSLWSLAFAFQSLFLCLLSESTRLLWPRSFRVHLWLPTGRAPIDQVTRGGRVEEWWWGQLGVRERDEPMTRTWSPPHQDVAWKMAASFSSWRQCTCWRPEDMSTSVSSPPK